MLSLNCIHLEKYSDNPLERALILAKNTNYLFSQFNGFTNFFSYIGKSKYNLKKIFFINSEKNFEDEGIHSRRILINGYLGQNLPNSHIYSNDEIFPKDTILSQNLSKLNKNINLVKLKEKKNKLPLFFYDLSKLPKYYFNEKIDQIIFDHLLKYLKLFYKNHKLIKISKKINLKVEKQIVDNLSLSTHYSLKKNYKNNNFIGYDSLEFLNQPVIDNLIKKRKISASNIFYEDLYSYFVRKTLKKSVGINNRIMNNKILIIDNPNRNKSNKSNPISKKIKNFLKIKNIKTHEEDWLVFKKICYNSFNCKIHFLYLRKNKLIFKNNSKKTLLLNEKNLKKIIKNYESIICTPNYLSLLIKFLFNKNYIFYSKKNINKKIFLNENILFSKNNDLVYGDFFKNKFDNFKEIILFLFNKYKVLK